MTIAIVIILSAIALNNSANKPSIANTETIQAMTKKIIAINNPIPCITSLTFVPKNLYDIHKKRIEATMIDDCNGRLYAIIPRKKIICIPNHTKIPNPTTIIKK